MKNCGLTELVKENLIFLDNYIENYLKKLNTTIYEDCIIYLCKNSKKIRSTILFLFAKALNIEINEKIYNIAFAIELIHNASIIHDDIIDNCNFRRKNKALHKKYTNSTAILTGDFLLSICLEILLKFRDIEILNQFKETLKIMCIGEFDQYFNKNKIVTIENYINKCENKTAKLFELELEILCEIFQIDETKKTHLKSFAKNFGIAFQIKNDLEDIYNPNYLCDFENGVYTSNVIYANLDNKSLLNMEKKEIIEIIRLQKYTKKTKNLIKYYTNLSNKSLENLDQNQYIHGIIDICKYVEE